MNAAALKQPDYHKMLKSWIIFALAAFVILWISSFIPAHYDSNGRFHYGYEIGLIFISIPLFLILLPFTMDEDEKVAAAISFVPAGLFTLSLLYFARWNKDDIGRAIILIAMAIVFLCISLMPFGDKKGKEKYPRRWDRVKAYALSMFLITCFTGIALLAIKYVL